MTFEEAQKELNPHREAVLAMLMYGDEYARQPGGSMDFYDSLSEAGVAAMVVDRLDPALQRDDVGHWGAHRPKRTGDGRAVAPESPRRRGHARDAVGPERRHEEPVVLPDPCRVVVGEPGEVRDEVLGPVVHRLGHGVRAAVSRRDPHATHGLFTGQPPGQGVLAAAAADQQHIDLARPSARIARHGPS